MLLKGLIAPEQLICPYPAQLTAVAPSVCRLICADPLLEKLFFHLQESDTETLLSKALSALNGRLLNLSHFVLSHPFYYKVCVSV